MSQAGTSSNRPSTAEAERLWRAWKERGDSAARDRLVLLYSPMVRYLAQRKLRELPVHCELDDLVSCGLIALMRAVERFDPAKGATFEQFAWTRVVGAIVDELRRQDWVPRATRRLGREIEEARQRLLIRNGQSPSDHELATELGMSVGELSDRLADLQRADLVSLNSPVRSSDDGTLEVGDLLVSSSAADDPEGQALASERALVVRKAIRSLSERERMVLELVYVQNLQGREVAQRLGVSDSRVSQILSGAREALRKAVESYQAGAPETPPLLEVAV
jgi:RNA polymerase sigma factor for flagellar operon FliA